MSELSGGYVNRLYLRDNQVVKSYEDGKLSISSSERIKREMTALNKFGGIISPRLIGFHDNEVVMEFIDADSLEETMVLGTAELRKNIAWRAGEMLRRIHEDRITDDLNIYLVGYSRIWF